MKKTLKICLIATTITSILLGASTFHLYRANASLEDELAISHEEVSLGCPEYAGYAMALEKENIRLSRQYRRCQRILDIIENLDPE